MNQYSDHPESAATGERLFSDLRRHNERAADVARRLAARRREQVERVIEVAREHRFARPSNG